MDLRTLLLLLLLPTAVGQAAGDYGEYWQQEYRWIEGEYVADGEPVRLFAFERGEPVLSWTPEGRVAVASPFIIIDEAPVAQPIPPGDTVRVVRWNEGVLSSEMSLFAGGPEGGASLTYRLFGDVEAMPTPDDLCLATDPDIRAWGAACADNRWSPLRHAVGGRIEVGEEVLRVEYAAGVPYASRLIHESPDGATMVYLARHDAAEGTSMAIDRDPAMPRIETGPATRWTLPSTHDALRLEAAVSVAVDLCPFFGEQWRQGGALVEWYRADVWAFVVQGESAVRAELPRTALDGAGQQIMEVTRCTEKQVAMRPTEMPSEMITAESLVAIIDQLGGDVSASFCGACDGDWRAKILLSTGKEGSARELVLEADGRFVSERAWGHAEEAMPWQYRSGQSGAIVSPTWSAPEQIEWEQTPPAAWSTVAAAGLLVGLILWRIAAVVFGFSRLGAKDVMGHPVRQRIMTVLEREPGLGHRPLMDRVGCGNGALGHHLRVMQRHDLIERQGTAYFRRGRHDSTDQQALAALRSARGREIASAVGAGSMGVSALAEVVGRSPSTVRHHLNRLEEAGIVHRRVRGRRLMYQLTDVGRRSLAS